METKNTIKNKIDFAVIMAVEHANPNGDPLNGNRPRQTYERLGEISDVCQKRKLRNRLLDMGASIFVQADDKRKDDFRSLNDRFDAAEKENKGQDVRKWTCEKWLDVRLFGQLFAFKKKDLKKKDDGSEDTGAVSIGIRGPVTIQSAYSLDEVIVDSTQITKSVNLETDKKNPDKRGADTMGMKHRVIKGVYVAYGSINTQLASLTGVTDEDVALFLKALRSIFENDSSSARPEGTMEVLKVVWWKHNCAMGQYSSAKVHRALKSNLNLDGTFDEEKVRSMLPDLQVEFFDQLEGSELL